MKKVIVIGGGYGGLRAIEHLINNKKIELYLFDENSYHYLQTEAYGYIAGRFDLHDVALDLKNWCHGFKRPITFIQEKVEFIDSSKQTVQTKTSTFDYDYLIVATGARTNFFDFISGMDTYGFGVKKLFRSHSFRTSFEELLYKKLVNGSTSNEKINLVIGGAGLSGVEIAAEMSNVIKKHSKSIADATKEIQIYLVDASDTILPGMSPYIIQNTQVRLDNLGVNTLTKAFIESVDSDTVYFKDKRELKYTFMIFTGGILANSIDSDIEFQKNRLNQYICDSTQRIAENIFTIGDCCEIRNKNNIILPPTAQIAEKSAEYVADSITGMILNQKPKPFDAKVDGLFVALGGNYAVGELFGFIKTKGYIAYILKKLITKSYYIGLKLRLNTGFKKRTILNKGVLS
ncbi:NAD(P)/FAD-dependent oxidoreductase [Sulfurimonas lithotrophica]|uniref:NAD(P)/FAD-dependent oxidoreductase n=1 Tax=Sulfurimonas lithotrophica TaxID=2590022 RepID=A0A5P8P0V2_9BACT|nr:FAD-dependent oxidoreductase [Sulfurimonas lithotrophica]QFR49294.1 NAD(P)/FAD-dependent oxidoreductase [Sulfurimonas lithotrophica]